MADNGPKGNKSRPGSQDENDPILQGVDRVQSTEEIDSHLASEQQEATEDTHTRSNIHLGGRDDEGKGTGLEEDEASVAPPEVDFDNLGVRNYPVPDGGPIEPSGGEFVPVTPEPPEDPNFQSSGRATPEIDIDENSDGRPTIEPYAAFSRNAAEITPLAGDEFVPLVEDDDEPGDENGPPETAPVDLGATDEDTSRTFSDDDLLVNATDPDGDTLTVSDVTINPDFGVIIDNGDGTYTFEPSPDFNGDDLPIDYTISDGTTDIPGSAIIDVLPVNDPPTSADAETVIDEDTSYTFGLVDFEYSDIENDDFSHITIIDLPTNGTLTFDGVVVDPGDEIPASDLGLLVFTPDENENGEDYATFNFTVNDGTDDSEQFTFSIDVTPVNDAPTSADENAVIDEDTSYTFVSEDFLFEDIDGDSLHHITIVDLPGQGALTFDGVAVAPGDEILAADIGLLVFTPDADDNGADYATFNFTVNDGTDDSEQYTYSIDVTPVNDPPEVDDNEVAILEDNTHVFDLTDFTENYDDIEGDSAAFVTITSLPIEGTLTIGGAAVILGDNNKIAVADIGDLVFTPDENENGDDYAAFNFTVEDDGVEPATSAEQTFTIDVTPVNDAPTTADNEKTILEDTTYSFVPADFAYDDVEGDVIHHITITELPADGALTLSGGLVSQGDEIAAADIANLLYTPAENASGENYGDFKFTVNDGSVDSDEHSFSVDVTADADTPDLCLLGPIGETTGLYDISGGGIVSMDISYNISPALFENTHGYYVADSDGNPIGGAVIQDDISNGGSFDVSFNTNDYPGGVTLGFFIIPDGNQQNVALEDGDAVTFSEIGGVWTPFVGGIALSGAPGQPGYYDDEDSMPAFFSNPALNADGIDHLENNQELGNQNWEDLVFGGDFDYGDVNANLTVTLQTCDDTVVQGLEGTLIGLPDILTELNDTDGSEILSVTISSIPEGVILSDDQGNEFTATDVESQADVSGWNLNELKVFSPVGQDDFVVQVTSTATEQSNSDQANTSLNVTVDILHGPTTDLVDLGATPEDTGIVFTEAQLLENAADLDGDTLHAFNVTIDPAFGSITDNGAGNYTFIPTADFNGIDLPVSYEITDGIVTIDGSAIIDVTPVNDVPTLDDNETTILEDNSHTFELSDFTENYDDVEGDSAAFVTITSLPLDGTLTIGGAAVVLGDNNKIAVADIGDLVFTPAENESGDDYAVFNFTVEDDGAAPATSAEHSFTVDVTPVNDVPTLDDNETTILEDNSHTFELSDFTENYDDVEGDSAAFVTITSLPLDGTLTIGGAAVVLGDNNKIAVADIGDLVFTPAENESGDDYAVFNFTVEDDGAAPATSAEHSFTVDVTPVNDVPTLDDNETTILEDNSHTFELSDFTENYDDVEGDSAAFVTITSLPLDGTLTIGGAAVVLGDNNKIAVADIGDLVFTPAENESGDDYAVFNFTVEDDGAAPATSAEHSFTVDVTPVNDVPTLDDNETTILEDNSHTFELSDFTENYDDVEGDSAAFVTITSLPLDGTLTIGGAAVVLGDNNKIAVADIGDLVFTPAENESGDDYAVFNFTVEDDGAAPATSAEHSFTVDVTPVNDVPTLDDNETTILEDNSHTFELSDFTENYDDVEGDSAAFVTITSLPLDGTLTIGGAAVVLGDNNKIAVADIGDLVFTPAENESGDDYAVFNFTVEDDGAAPATSAEHSFTVDVTPVNDVPTLDDNETTILEDNSHTFELSDFTENYDDVEGDSAAFVTITSLPLDGTLTIGGAAVVLGDNNKIAVADIGDLVFTPAENESGDDYAVFNFTVEDDGAAPATSAEHSFTVDVTPVNDVPTLDDNETTILEDNSHTFELSDFTENYDDVEGDSAAFVTITSLPLDGTLTIGGAAVVLGDNNKIAVADIGDLVFTPAENESGDDYAVFNFTVEDDGAAPATSAEHSFTVDVTAVADDPNLCVLSEKIDGSAIYDISQGGIVTVNVEYFAVDAGYENSHGYYIADSDGNPIGGKVVKDNVKELGIEEISFDTADYPGGVTLGFFIIPDGDTQNPLLESDDAVTFQNIGGTWTPFVGGVALVGAQAAPAYFSDMTLNPDGFDHFDDTGVAGNQNWEDLWNGGDTDNTDVNAFVTLRLCDDEATVQGYEETPIALPEITGMLTDLDGSESLMMTLSNIPDGVEVKDGDGNSFVASAGNNSADVTGWDLHSLEVIAPAGTDDFVLGVEAKSTEASNNDTATTNGTITVDILHVPTTSPVDLGSTLEDTSIDFTATKLLENADDLDGDILSISNVAIDPIYGTITDNGGGSYTFDPTDDYNGDDLPISYDIFDGENTISGSAIIDVTADADAPEITMIIGDVVNESEVTPVIINTGNVLDTDNGYTVTGRIVNPDGTLSEALAANLTTGANGIGVGGVNDGPDDQLGAVESDGQSEEIIITVEQSISSIDVVINYLFEDDDGQTEDEIGYYTLLEDGAEVGSGTFYGVAGGLEHTLSINPGGGVTFDQIVFTADTDLTTGTEGHSDYYISSATFDRVSDEVTTHLFPVTITTALTDTDGSESLSDVTISDVPADAMFEDGDGSPVGTNNNDGTWTFTNAELEGLMISVPVGHDDFELSAAVTSTETSNADFETSTTQATVDVPEAPVSADAAFSSFAAFSVGAPLIEDTGFAFSLAHFSFSDGDGDAFDHMTIVELPAKGKLQFEGDPVVEGQDVPAASMGSLVFVPDENESGENYTSFKFTVSDGELNSEVHTFSIDVEAEADAPEISLSLGEASANMVVEVEDVIITPDNVLETGDGFIATARSINNDGSLSDASADNVYVSGGSGYFAVKGENDGPNNQIGYSDAHEKGEELIISLDEGVSSLTFGYKYLYSDEEEYQAGTGKSGKGKSGSGKSGSGKSGKGKSGTGKSGSGTHDEQGHYVLYNDGVEVGAGTFYGTENGTEAFVTVTAAGGVMFDQIVFTADPELTNDGDGHSDYALTSISFESSTEVIESYTYSVDITAGLIDTDLSETLSIVSVSGVPEDAIFYDASETLVGTNNGDGSWSFTDGELDSLVMTVPQEQANFDLTASVTATETSNDDAETSSAAITVVTGDNDNNVLASSAANNFMFGFDGNDAFAIGASDAEFNVRGGNGESWVDTIELSGFNGLDHEVGWTLVLDGGATIQSTDDEAGEMILSQDADGTITFDDGGSVTFENIEKISW